MKRQLVLEDGSVFIGEGFGSTCDLSGEVVFNTGMTGYQEILTDPSYCGQIVTMTYPLIGNYGINRDDFESIEPSVYGMIVRELCDMPSNWRNAMTLDEFLKTKKIPGLSGIDTRKLTKIIRKHGTLKGRICSIDIDVDNVISQMKAEELDTKQVSRVSSKIPYVSPGEGYRVVIIDFGMKHGILRELKKRGCDCFVLPYNTTIEEVLSLHPDGIMLTNGPGNPKDVPGAIDLIQNLVGIIPLFGICLGHQLFALALGADTEKMKFGHRGSNQPVKNLESGKVAITSQNHGFTVNENSLKNTRLEVTHIALNDGSIEGVRHLDYPAFTVQYHPEASPGPEDENGLFDQFIEMIEAHKGKSEHSQLLKKEVDKKEVNTNA